MDNITWLDPLHTEDAIGIGQHITEVLTTYSPYILNTTNPSGLDRYNSTQTNWTADSQVENDPSLTALWMYIAVRTVSGVLAIVGNSLTIIVVTKFEQLQTCTNYLICSLAVSDLLSGVMVPLVIVHELYSSSQLFIPICLLQQTMAIISSAGNGLNILYISIDRYIYIAIPLRYHGLVIPQRIAVILIVTWIFGLICTPIIIFTGNNLQVGMPCRYHIFLNEWVTTIYMAPQAAVVICLIIVFHLAIAKIAHKQARSIHAQQLPYDTLDVAINNSTKKISRTLAMVLGVYLCSVVPQIIMASITFNNKPLESIERYTVALYWANTWINPFIYAWRLKDFRIAFKKMFTRTGSFNEVQGIPA